MGRERERIGNWLKGALYLIFTFGCLIVCVLIAHSNVCLFNRDDALSPSTSFDFF